jgi:hypothetical protein
MLAGLLSERMTVTLTMGALRVALSLRNKPELMTT